MKRYFELILLAKRNPTTAPQTVPISRRTAKRKFVRWSFKKLAAAPEEVAKMEIKLAAMAYRMLIPRARVNTGTIIMPPPSPKREPRKPANKDEIIKSIEYIFGYSKPVHIS